MHNPAQLHADRLAQAARSQTLIASDELTGQERMLISMYRALSTADKAALFRVLHPMVIHSISN